jgi:predicted acyltransferase
VVADLIAVTLDLIKVNGPDGSRVPLGSWIYETLFASWASPVNASLVFAIAFVLVCLGLMWILFRRKIFIKV